MNRQGRCPGLSDAERFLETLRELIAKYGGKSSSDIARAGNMDERTARKCVNGKNKGLPKRDTVICLCFGIGLNAEDSIILMESAGYGFDLSGQSAFDKIVLEGIEAGKSILYVNEELWIAGIDKALGAGSQEDK